MTDDGALLHRITSPKAQLPKVYEATLAEDLRGDEAATFASGTLMLESENRRRSHRPALEALDAAPARDHHDRRSLPPGAADVRRGRQPRRIAASRVASAASGSASWSPAAWRLLDAQDLDALFGRQPG